MGILVFISVLLVAACGLIYELVAGTLASYLVGDSVFQFSTIIGTYLFAMGVGSALSRYINRGLANRFVWIELLLGVIGGFSSALLMLAFAFTQGFELILYAVVIVMGVLVGLEIPLLMRIVRDRYQFRDVIAHVLTFDYLGALGASLLFPVLLVPRLGLVRSAMLFGLINAGVALWSTFLFANQLSATRRLRVACRLVRIGRGTCRGERDHRHRRRQHLCRRDHPCPRHSLPASRPHAFQGRPPSFSQQPSAIQLPRRIPLP